MPSFLSSHTRIFVPASDGSFEDDVHGVCLDENFVDENEALTFVRERVLGRVDVSADPTPSSSDGSGSFHHGGDRPLRAHIGLLC